MICSPVPTLPLGRSRFTRKGRTTAPLTPRHWVCDTCCLAGTQSRAGKLGSLGAEYELGGTRKGRASNSKALSPQLPLSSSLRNSRTWITYPGRNPARAPTRLWTCSPMPQSWAPINHVLCHLPSCQHPTPTAHHRARNESLNSANFCHANPFSLQ